MLKFIRTDRKFNEEQGSIYQLLECGQKEFALKYSPGDYYTRKQIEQYSR